MGKIVAEESFPETQLVIIPLGFYNPANTALWMWGLVAIPDPPTAVHEVPPPARASFRKLIPAYPRSVE
jgi:hypothetical protein